MEKFLQKGTETTAPVPMTPVAGTTKQGCVTPYGLNAAFFC